MYFKYTNIKIKKFKNNKTNITVTFRQILIIKLTIQARKIMKKNIMKNHKLLKIIFINIILILLLTQILTFSYAITSTELKNRQKDIDKQIEETNSEIAGVKSKMTKTLSQIDSLNAEISTYESEIANLSTQI